MEDEEEESRGDDCGEIVLVGVVIVGVVAVDVVVTAGVLVLRLAGLGVSHIEQEDNTDRLEYVQVGHSQGPEEDDNEGVGVEDRDGD